MAYAAYEAICSTARAVAAQSHVAYVPHTMTECLALIDRPAYLAHVAAIGVAVATLAYHLFLLEKNENLGHSVHLKHTCQNNYEGETGGETSFSFDKR
jgi:hypothetical protein